MELEKFQYDNKIVKWFIYATIFWGLVGMLAGLLAALQLVFPVLNLDLPYTTFGRVRPVHTNAVIFAFVGNGIFMGVYYSLQRLVKARMFSDFLSKLHFWGWQIIIVLAAITLFMGYTTGKEYAELEWPLDILIAFVWVVFGWNMFGTIIRRRERHLYVAIWFYIATFITVAMPDKERGAVVKAYIVLAPELIAARARSTWAIGRFDAELTEELQLHVKKMLAPYEYPKEIEFIDALPMTTTGKVQRRVLRLQEEERFKKLS